MGEGVAEEPRHPQRDVDPGPAELGQRRSARARSTRPLPRPTRGRTPSSASASATSSPPVRIALVPHTTSPTDAGRPTLLGHGAARPAGRPGAGPTSQASRDGTALGSSGVEVAAGRQHVGHAPARRAARPRRDEPAVERGAAPRRARRSVAAQRRHEALADPARAPARRARRRPARLGRPSRAAWQRREPARGTRPRARRCRGAPASRSRSSPSVAGHLGAQRRRRRPGAAG